MTWHLCIFRESQEVHFLSYSLSHNKNKDYISLEHIEMLISQYWDPLWRIGWKRCSFSSLSGCVSFFLSTKNKTRNGKKETSGSVLVLHWCFWLVAQLCQKKLLYSETQGIDYYCVRDFRWEEAHFAKDAISDSRLLEGQVRSDNDVWPLHKSSWRGRQSQSFQMRKHRLQPWGQPTCVQNKRALLKWKQQGQSFSRLNRFQHCALSFVPT